MIRIAVSLAAFVWLAAFQPATLLAQNAKSSRTTAAKPAVSGTVNINTASVTDLQGLPGIGAKTAARIIEYRQKNGPFKKVEELMNVRGVGEKNFLKLKPQLTVGAAKADHEQQNRFEPQP